MANNPFFDKLRSFLGIKQEPPKNDFRNPIWGDDDDDGDELYTRSFQDDHRDDVGALADPRDLHRDVARQMHQMFQAFGSIFGDNMKTFLHDFDNAYVESSTNTPVILPPSDPEKSETNNIRDYYLKPGYHNKIQHHDKEDMDLDGKISSHDIAGLLTKRDEESKPPATHFNSELVPGMSFCRTIITTSITKPDGSRETKRIVKDGNGVVEETITTTEPDPKGPISAMDSFNTFSPVDYTSVFSELGSIFRNFY